jgi:hypothetical protein
MWHLRNDPKLASQANQFRSTSTEGAIMSFCKSHWRTLLGAALLGIVAVSSSSVALASQGPGAGRGTASPVTQLMMSVAVYGSAALVVGAGLIGAIRRRH